MLPGQEDLGGTMRQGRRHPFPAFLVVLIATSICTGVAGVSAASSLHRDVARGAPTFGTWSNAREVPHSAALNAGGSDRISTMSCASVGTCSAAGYYLDGSHHDQAFVVNEKNSVWGNALEVPRTSILNTGGNAIINSMSCASAASCSAGGSYTDGSNHQQAFVVSEVRGSWGAAIEVPGTAALNTRAYAQVVSVSCASPGTCSAGGSYADRASHGQGFLVNEDGGAWTNAVKVPGLGALNAGGFAEVTSVSCAAAGACGAGGHYRDGSHHYQVFVVSEKNSVWGNASEVPRTSILNTGGNANINSMSCASAGNCSAGGYYTDGAAHRQVYVVNYTPPPPTVTSLRPGSGTTRGGTIVIVHGTHLNGAIRVLFGTRVGTHLTVVNADAIRVTTPAGTGIVNVRVSTGGGTSAVTSKDRFRYG